MSVRTFVEGQHRFIATNSFTRLSIATCNHCLKYRPKYFCQCCLFFAHKKCIPRITTLCRPSCIPLTPSEENDVCPHIICSLKDEKPKKEKEVADEKPTQRFSLFSKFSRKTDKKKREESVKHEEKTETEKVKEHSLKKETNASEKKKKVEINEDSDENEKEKVEENENENESESESESESENENENEKESDSESESESESDSESENESEKDELFASDDELARRECSKKQRGNIREEDEEGHRSEGDTLQFIGNRKMTALRLSDQAHYAIAPSRKSKKINGVEMHYWLRGNIRFIPHVLVKRVCTVCEASIGNSDSDYRCCWCKRMVHRKCFKWFHQNCDYGFLSDYIARPSDVVQIAQNKFELRIPRSSKRTPIVFIVNPKSGGQRGAEMITRLKYFFNPHQIFNVFASPNGPQDALDFAETCERSLIFACGGDGTVNWVLESLRRRGMKRTVGMLPIGTGNDLANVFGWSSALNDVEQELLLIPRAVPQTCDRWAIEYSEDGEHYELVNTMNNYWSIGLDADIACAFHNAREKQMDLFSNILFNRLVYVKCATEKIFSQSSLKKRISILVDGNEIDISPFCCIDVININKMYGGTTPWPEKSSKFHKSEYNDGIIEVFGIRNFMDLAVVSGDITKPVKVAQGSEIIVTTIQHHHLSSSSPPISAHTPDNIGKGVPVQVDGEPSRAVTGKVRISLLEQVSLLQARKKVKRNQSYLEKV